MIGLDLKRATTEKPAADDWFTVLLLRVILKADGENKKKLAKGFPIEVAACNIFKTDCPYLDDQKHNVDYDGVVTRAEEVLALMDALEPKLTLCEAIACLAVPCNPAGVNPDERHDILKIENPTPENIQDWYSNIITTMKERAEGGKMAKVTTADCKAWIVEHESPATNAKDWKRAKKYKQGDAIIRIFDNDVAGESIGIVERDGEIVGAQEKMETRWLLGQSVIV